MAFGSEIRTRASVPPVPKTSALQHSATLPLRTISLIWADNNISVNNKTWIQNNSDNILHDWRYISVTYCFRYCLMLIPCQMAVQVACRNYFLHCTQNKSGEHRRHALDQRPTCFCFTKMVHFPRIISPTVQHHVRVEQIDILLLGSAYYLIRLLPAAAAGQVTSTNDWVNRFSIQAPLKHVNINQVGRRSWTVALCSVTQFDQDGAKPTSQPTKRLAE